MPPSTCSPTASMLTAPTWKGFLMAFADKEKERTYKREWARKWRASNKGKVSEQIAALYVMEGGIYYGRGDVDPWDEARDARKYAGPWPVVAHPPCQLWGPFAPINFKRWGGEHNRPGNDGGCFRSALAAVRRFGGVLEHPLTSKAWAEFGIPKPWAIGWCPLHSEEYEQRRWICEVWQSAYGHRANKRTMLYYCGEMPPPDLIWDRPKGTHQCGFHDQRGKARNKPTISGKAASATPTEFANLLLSIARTTRKP